MTSSRVPTASGMRAWIEERRHSENQLTLLPSLVTGVLVGLVTVAFILITGRLAAHMYPSGGSGWRRILNLDPMRPGLAGEERYQRSVHVLQLVADKVAQCLTPAQASASVDLIGDTNAALKRHLKASGQNDAVDSNPDLANKLWQTERANCTAAVSPADEPLRLMPAKAAQE